MVNVFSPAIIVSEAVDSSYVETVMPGFNGVVVEGPIWFSSTSGTGRILLVSSSTGLIAYDTNSGERLWWSFRGIPVYGAVLDDAEDFLVVLTSTGLEAYNTSSWSLLWANSSIVPQGSSVKPTNIVAFMKLYKTEYLVLVLKYGESTSSYRVYVFDDNGVIVYNKTFNTIYDVEWNPLKPLLAFTADNNKLVLVDFTSSLEPRERVLFLNGARGVSWNTNGSILGIARGYYGVSIVNITGSLLKTIYVGFAVEKLFWDDNDIIAAGGAYLGKISMEEGLVWVSPPVVESIMEILGLSHGRIAVVAYTSYYDQMSTLYVVNSMGLIEKIYPLYSWGVENIAKTDKGVVVVTDTEVVFLDIGGGESATSFYRHGIPLLRKSFPVNSSSIVVLEEENIGFSRAYSITYHNIENKSSKPITIISSGEPSILYTGNFTSVFLREGYIATYSTNGSLEWTYYIEDPFFSEAAWSSSGELLAVYNTLNKRLHIINRSGELVASKTYPEIGYISSISISPDNNYVALIGYKNAYILNASSLEILMSLENIEINTLHQVQWSTPNRLWIMLKNDSLLIVDPSTNTTRQVKPPLLDYIDDIEISPKGDLIAAVGSSRSGEIKDWILVFTPEGMILWKKELDSTVNSLTLSWSDKGNYIVLSLVGGSPCIDLYSRTIIYNARNGGEVKRIPGWFEETVYYEDDDIIALLPSDNGLWELYSFDENSFEYLGVKPTRLIATAYTSKGAYMNIYFGDEEPYLWLHVDSKRSIVENRTENKWFDIVSPSGDQLIELSYYCAEEPGGASTAARLRAYSFQGGKLWEIGGMDPIDPEEASFSPFDDLLVLPVGWNSFYQIDYVKGILVGRRAYSDTGAVSISYSPGKVVYSYKDVITTVNPSLQVVSKIETREVVDAAISPKGDLLAIIQSNESKEKLLVYSIVNQSLVYTTSLPGRAFYLAWSGNGGEIAVFTDRSHLTVIEVGSWKIREYPKRVFLGVWRSSLKPHGVFSKILWSPSNEYIVLTSFTEIEIARTSMGRTVVLNVGFEIRDAEWINDSSLAVVGSLGVDVYNLAKLFDVEEKIVYNGISYNYRRGLFRGNTTAIIVGFDKIVGIDLEENNTLIIEKPYSRITGSPQTRELYVNLGDVAYKTTLLLEPLTPLYFDVNKGGSYIWDIVPSRSDKILLLHRNGLILVDRNGMELWSNMSEVFQGIYDASWSPSSKTILAIKHNYTSMSANLFVLDANSGKLSCTREVEGFLVANTWLGEKAYLLTYNATQRKLHLFVLDTSSCSLREIGEAVSVRGSYTGNTIAIAFRNTTIMLIKENGEVKKIPDTGLGYLDYIGLNESRVYGYRSDGVLVAIDTTDNRTSLYGIFPSHQILAELGEEKIAVGSPYSGVFIIEPAYWSLLYIYPPKTPVTISIEEKVFDLDESGARLYLKPGNTTIEYHLNTPLQLNYTVLGDESWYKRLVVEDNISLKPYTATTIKPPTSSSFEKQLGGIRLDASKTNNTVYQCNILWEPNGLEQLSLKSGEHHAYKALPGTYKIKCTYGYQEETNHTQTLEEVFEKEIIVKQGEETIISLPQAKPTTTTTTPTTITATATASPIQTTTTSPTTTTSTTQTTTTTSPTATETTTTAITTTQTTMTTSSTTTPSSTTTNTQTTTTSKPTSTTTTLTSQTSTQETTTATSTTTSSITTQTSIPTNTTTTIPQKGVDTTAYIIAAILAIIIIIILVVYRKQRRHS